MSKPVDLQSFRDWRDAERERAEIRRQGFATSNLTLQKIAFSVANEDWPALEALLAEDEATDIEGTDESGDPSSRGDLGISADQSSDP